MAMQPSIQANQHPPLEFAETNVDNRRETGLSRYHLAGKWMVAIAALHTLLGILVGMRWITDPQMASAIGDRVLLVELMHHKIAPHGQVDLLLASFFWFLFFGFLGMILGHSMILSVTRPHRLALIGWELAALALSGGYFIPQSGFWLALLPAGILLLTRWPTLKVTKHEAT